MPLERNREKTRKRLIQAVESLLWRKGFKGLGVNAVAREAGVDKVLIYRYFGGLPGLIAVFGREGDFWPSVSELAGGDPKGFSRLTFEAKLTALGRNFLAAMQQRPLTQEIMAWEMVERNELTVELEIIRENIILRFMEMYFPELDTDIDIEAITALMGAGISYLVTRSRQIYQYSGIDLKSGAGWRRLETAMESIVRGVTGLMETPSNG